MKNLTTIYRLLAVIIILTIPSLAIAQERLFVDDVCCVPRLEESPLLMAKANLPDPQKDQPLILFPAPPEPQAPTRERDFRKEYGGQSDEASDYDYEDRWTVKDTFFQLQYTVLHVIDWGQTRHISKNDEYYETNPLLGSKPSTELVDIYFAVTLIGHTTVSYLLPAKWRRKWQAFTSVLETVVTAHNQSIGIAVGF